MLQSIMTAALTLLSQQLDGHCQAACQRLRSLSYPLRAVPELRWDLRGRAAGQAHLGRALIRLNAALLLQEGEDFALSTLVHELCHLAVWARHGRKARPHGPEWRALMQAMGQSPQRCHDAPVQAVRQQRTFRYACPCSEHALSTTRHNRAQRGVRYLCRRCAQPLKEMHASTPL